MKSIRNGGLSTLNKNNSKNLEEKNNNENNALHLKNIREFDKKLNPSPNDTKGEESLQNSISDYPTSAISKEKQKSIIPSIKAQIEMLEQKQNISDNRLDSIVDKLEIIEKKISKISYDIDLLYDKNISEPEIGNSGAIIKSSRKELLFEADNIIDKKDNIASKKLMDQAEKETYLTKKSIPKRKKIAPKQVAVKTDVLYNQTIKLQENPTMQQGISEFHKGNYQNSIKLLSEAKLSETSKKNQSEIAFYLAESFFQSGDYKHALSNYQNVVSNNNSNFTAESQLKYAESYMRLGKIVEAKLAYQKLIASYPESQFVPIARKMLQQL